jgi:NADPH-dependent 2,4-dienoyl-CoA reductase/sulfur reductase-like enzyme
VVRPSAPDSAGPKGVSVHGCERGRLVLRRPSTLGWAAADVTAGRKCVVVIGAGIAGLVTAKVLRGDGFDVTVFEKEPAVGGVWAESRTYPGLRTNNSRRTYAFSDHPYDRSADVFPTADQVRRYLASYVARFGLAPLIRLSTGVAGVSRRGDGFEVAVRGPAGAACVACDFVVVCAGQGRLNLGASLYLTADGPPSRPRVAWQHNAAASSSISRLWRKLLVTA